ncbi:MAG: sigma-70 family RNA polymerase sigma factor [Eubacteriaceae bacterium]|nr:sigma-70 family RNA polymerase sigma factor [Eubacteriaceae bacterium]
MYAQVSKLRIKIILKISQILYIFRKGVYFITGTEVLPPPMDTDEEMRAIEGLRHKENWAKKELIERNLRLVVYIAKKFENTNANIEDMVSLGSIGLIKAVNTFDTDKNIKFATYASKCIENEMRMHLRKYTKIKNELSLDEPLNTDSEGNELLLCDILETGEDSVFMTIEKNSDSEILWDLINKLNDRDQDILKKRFGLCNLCEMTQKEIADEMNISQSYISRLEKKLINQLKKDMCKLI